MANGSVAKQEGQIIRLRKWPLGTTCCRICTSWFLMHTQMEWVWNRYRAGNITEMYYYYDIATRYRV